MLTSLFGVAPIDYVLVGLGAAITTMAPAITGHRIEAALLAAAPHALGRWPVGLGPLIGLAVGIAITAAMVT